MNIYFAFEGQARELNARIHFCIEAAKNGHMAYFGHKVNVYPLMPKVEKGIFFHKSVQLRKYDLIKKYKDLGHFNASIDEEGLMRINEKIYFGYRLSKKALDELDVFFSWGDDHRKSIINYYPDLAGKVYSAGNSRIDILKNINKNDDKVSELKSKYGDFLLFATKFPRRNGMNVRKNSYAYTAKLNLKKYLGDSLDMSKTVYESLTKNQEWERDNMYGFMDAIEECAKHFSDKKIIVRPHPVEDLNVWYKFIDKIKLDNVIIENDGNSIIPWILAAEKIISHNCTTAVESAFVGVKTINYTPYPHDEFEYQLPIICSDNPRNIDELKKVITKNEVFDFDKKQVEYYVKNSGTKSFYDFSMETIEKMVDSRIFSKKNKIMNRFNFIFAKIFRILKMNYGLFFLLGRKRRIYFSQKFKGFNIKYVRKIIKSFSAQNDVDVVEAWPGVYLITKKLSKS